MVIVVEQAEALMLLLYLRVKAIPAYDVVLVLFVEGKFGMHIVLNHLFTTTVQKVFIPRCADFLAFYVVVSQRILVKYKARAHVNVVTRKQSENHRDNYCVYSREDYGTLADAEVPDLSI